jgi:hypothetical protein
MNSGQEDRGEHSRLWLPAETLAMRRLPVLCGNISLSFRQYVWTDCRFWCYTFGRRNILGVEAPGLGEALWYRHQRKSVRTNRREPLRLLFPTGNMFHAAEVSEHLMASRHRKEGRPASDGAAVHQPCTHQIELFRPVPGFFQIAYFEM